MRPDATYRGRFAPSPSGPLHLGSLVAALGSFLDARAHGGEWLVRMEDLDHPRNQKGADHIILQQLAVHGLISDAPVLYQNMRDAAYQRALTKLAPDTYRCFCARKPYAERTAEPCPSYLDPRNHGVLASNDAFEPKTSPFAIRLHVKATDITLTDAHKGAHTLKLTPFKDDMVLLRKDGIIAYHLAVVVDDGEQGMTHIVRGEDLLASTANHQYLQRALGYAVPTYRHLPLAYGAHGKKLSKQTGAAPLDTTTPIDNLNAALAVLTLSPIADMTIPAWLDTAIAQWRARFLQYDYK